MNGILSKSSDNKLHGVLSPKNQESVETAGSLAINNFHSLFDVNIYDMFVTDNPFAVDYSMYSDMGETVAYSGFLDSFSNAVSTLSNSSGFSEGGFSTGACSSCNSSSGGSFTSFC